MSRGVITVTLSERGARLLREGNKIQVEGERIFLNANIGHVDGRRLCWFGAQEGPMYMWPWDEIVRVEAEVL